MVPDSIPPASASHAKDCKKKKRANWSAKLKQSKMDARREQWLSQVKSKGAKADEERFIAVGGERSGKDLPLKRKLEVKPRGDEKGGDGEEGNREGSDSESSPLNSPGSVGSSVLSGSNISGTNFTGTSVSSCASSRGTCSGSVTENEEEEEKEEIVDESDGCVDDWEAIADALADNDKKHASNSDLPDEQELSPRSESSCIALEKGKSRGEVNKSQPQRVSKFSKGMRAWRADDAYRPHGLPNLSKHRSLPMKSGRHLVHGAAGFRSFNKILQLHQHVTVLYAMRSWMLLMQVFSHVRVGSGCAFSATNGSARMMDAALVAGSIIRIKGLCRGIRLLSEAVQHSGWLVI